MKVDYYHCLTSDATIMESHKCPVIGKRGGGGGGAVGVVCGDAVMRYFSYGFAENFILTCGVAVL